MRATFVTCAAGLFALSLAASEPQTTTAQPPAQQPALQEQNLSGTAPAQQQQDSPLVRAAKASGRLNKKPGYVITNETLLKEGGHWTTTQSQQPLETAAPAQQQTNSVIYHEALAGAKLRKQPVKANTKAKDAATLNRAMADYAGESIESVNDDPAAQEGVMSKKAPTTPTVVPATPAKPPIE